MNRLLIRRWALPIVLGSLLWLAIASAAPAAPLGQVTQFSGLFIPNEIAAGPDGTMWFTIKAKPAIGRIDPSTGQITEFTSGLNPGSDPSGITAGPDGSLWFADSGCVSGSGGVCAIGRINPMTGQITEFSAGLNAGSVPTEIATASEGSLWFTDQGTTPAIGRVDPSSGKITEISAGLNPGSRPTGIAGAPDGSVWFTDQGTTAAIGYLVPATGQIIEYTGLNSGSVPTRITVDPNGNAWFTDAGTTPAIGKFDRQTAEIIEYTGSGHLYPGNSPAGITVGPDGSVWFAASGSGGAIGRVDTTPGPTSGTITEYTAGLSTGSAPYGIAPGPDGNLWFTDLGSATPLGRIGAGAAAAVAAAPVASGSGRVGAPLSCQGASFSSWTGVAAQPSLYPYDGYRWALDGVPIAGQTGQTYTPATAAVGHQLSCSLAATYPLPFLVTAHTTSAPITVAPAVVLPAPSTPVAPSRPLRPLRVKLAFTWTWSRATTRLDRTRIGRFPADMTLTVRCLGRRCPRPAAVNAHGTRQVRRLLRGLAGHRYRAGERLRITMTAPGFLPEVGVEIFRDGRRPRSR